MVQTLRISKLLYLPPLAPPPFLCPCGGPPCAEYGGGGSDGPCARYGCSGLRRRRLSVSVNFKAGLALGFELGVCTAQNLMNNPINRISPIAISNTAHQYSIIQFFILASVFSLNIKFFSRCSGPSLSTPRQRENTSQ